MKAILLRLPSPLSSSYSTSKTAYRAPLTSFPRLLKLFALRSFSRKVFQSGLVDFSSTTISLPSSLSLKMIHLVCLPSLSSLKASTDSGATETPDPACESECC
jgi:hypothetical protein